MALTPQLGPPPASVVTSDQPSEEDSTQPPKIPLSELPHCPKCQTGLLRPGVVWFGEALPTDLVEEIDQWIQNGPVDLCLVVGTSGQVWPAAGYAECCKIQGAKVAIVNLEISTDPELGGLSYADWLFEGDCAQLLPEMLRPVIGDMDQVYQMLGGHDYFPPTTTTGGPMNGERTGEGTGYY